MVSNPGISFGIQIPGVSIISAIILGILIYWYFKERLWGIWVIVLGGGMNLAERILTGSVRDYWKIPYTYIYNNLADWLIFIGVIIYLWQKWKKK